MSIKILSHSRENSKPFDPTIRAAGLTVAPGVMTGGAKPDETLVTLRTAEETLSFTPAEACALAASLQAVAVFLLEQEPREICRRTEPGAPSFEDLGAGS